MENYRSWLQLQYLDSLLSCFLGQLSSFRLLGLQTLEDLLDVKGFFRDVDGWMFVLDSYRMLARLLEIRWNELNKWDHIVLWFEIMSTHARSWNFMYTVSCHSSHLYLRPSKNNSFVQLRLIYQCVLLNQSISCFQFGDGKVSCVKQVSVVSIVDINIDSFKSEDLRFVFAGDLDGWLDGRS